MQRRPESQSASDPQKSQGKQRVATQVQPWLQSRSIAQLVGSQNCPASQRSPAGQSASATHSGAMKQTPKSAQMVPAGQSTDGPPGGEQA
jgi:hypothetical protein